MGNHCVTTIHLCPQNQGEMGAKKRNDEQGKMKGEHGATVAPQRQSELACTRCGSAQNRPTTQTTPDNPSKCKPTSSQKIIW